MTTDGRRRRFLRRTVGVLLAGLAGCGSDGRDERTATPRTATPTPSVDRPGVGVVTVADGFTAPTDVAMPAGVDRTFVADQPGQVYAVDRPDTPFLDLSDRIVALQSGPDERGLLGLAPHPDFAANGRLFVRYSAPLRSSAPGGYSHTFVLSEVTVDPSAESASPDRERILLEIDQPQPNHNAGSLAFGTDGTLFVGIGDGGGSGDVGRGHAEDWYERIRGGNGQNLTENLLGSILRLDVSGDPYAVPDDNPLVGETGRDEQFAWGLRNPWRMSFGPEGRLFAADVGQNEFEEVDIIEKGGNYGWNVREGTHCFGADSCPDETPDGDPLIQPIIEYPHGGSEVSGISVTGGYLYDGEAIPELAGTYVFGDWRSQGELFVARERSGGLWPVTAIPVEGIGPFVPAFGRDSEGELLVCTSEDGGIDGSSGAVYRLESV